MLFNTPWANPSDSRLKPAAFQGADLAYTAFGNWTSKAPIWSSSRIARARSLPHKPADELSGRQSRTALKHRGPRRQRHKYQRLRLRQARLCVGAGGFSANAYYYGVDDHREHCVVRRKYTFGGSTWAPFIALQGGSESNNGQSYIGKVNSQNFGAQIGANLTKNLLLTVGYDSDSLAYRLGLPAEERNLQQRQLSDIATSGDNARIFLAEQRAAMLHESERHDASILRRLGEPVHRRICDGSVLYHKPSQGMTDRRAPGNSEKVMLTFTSTNKRWAFYASDAWYNYGNALAPKIRTSGTSTVSITSAPFGQRAIHGSAAPVSLRPATLSNTFCGASGTDCPGGATVGSTYLGGLPLFKYNRAQLEYDF